MAAQPSKDAEWAISFIQQVEDINGDDIPEVLDNKIEPTPEWKLSGQLFQENLPYPYFNYQFDLIDKWLKHLNERYIVGDVHLSTSGESAAVISIRLGGTWADNGTDTIAGTLVTLYEKTA